MYLLLTFDKNLMTNDQWQMIFFFCMLTYHLNFSSLIDLAKISSQKLNYHNYTMHYILYVLEIEMHIC